MSNVILIGNAKSIDDVKFQFTSGDDTYGVPFTVEEFTNVRCNGKVDEDGKTSKLTWYQHKDKGDSVAARFGLSFDEQLALRESPEYVESVNALDKDEKTKAALIKFSASHGVERGEISSVESLVKKCRKHLTSFEETAEKAVEKSTDSETDNQLSSLSTDLKAMAAVVSEMLESPGTVREERAKRLEELTQALLVANEEYDNVVANLQTAKKDEIVNALQAKIDAESAMEEFESN